MHVVVGQPEFDVVQQTIENDVRLFPGEIAAFKGGRSSYVQGILCRNQSEKVVCNKFT